MESSSADDIVSKRNGLKDIWNLVDPVWKFTHEELVKFMVERIIYETDEVIVFNKPFQMAYASASKDQAQLDRLLEGIRKEVVPDCKRLYNVTTLDKYCTIPHVVRSHLYYGLNCPIVGDLKYKRYIPKHKTGHNFYNLSNNLLALLNVGKAAARNLPIYMHLHEVHLPENENGKYSIINTEIPSFFRYTLKNLKLLKK